ncbi:MAG: PKD domain-containing protein [Crocinitomicaceae bacterium]
MLRTIKRLFSLLKVGITPLFAICSLLLAPFVYSQTADVVQGCVPLTVNFTAPAGSSTFYWDFMDGASANIQNPSNTFINPGSYVVEFKNSASGPVVGTVTINVYAKPIPTITAIGDTKGCLPLPVNFQTNVTLPSGITVTTYTWTYGEGSSGTGQNVNFVYNTPGIFNVSIGIITNTPSCNNTVTFNSFVGVSNPVANFSTSPSPAFSCTSPLNVVFTNTSISTLPLTYQWDMGNSATSTAVNPPSQTYTALGTVNVELIITDTNNCVKTVTKPITVGGPTASFDSPDTVCINDFVFFENSSTSAGSVSWSFGPNAEFPTSNLNSLLNAFSVAGPVNVQMTILSPGGLCNDDTIRTIFVEDPTVIVSGLPYGQCDTHAVFNYSVNTTSNIVNYDWHFEDGQISSLANPTIIYHIQDTAYKKRRPRYVYGFLVFTTSGGCIDTTFFTDTIHWVGARFMPDKYHGCAPLTVTFSDSTLSDFPITNYHYEYGDGTFANFSSASAPNIHVYSNPGVYQVVMTADNSIGCSNTSDTIWIEVGATIPLNFSIAPTTICPGESVTMTNLSPSIFPDSVDGWHYSSDGELLSACHENPNGVFVFNDSVGVFDITLTADYNGCISNYTLSNVLTVLGPIADFNYLYDCADTMDLQLYNKSQGYTSLLWDFGDGTTSTATDPLHTYVSTGDYWVKLTATNATSGCSASVDSALIHIRKIQAVFNNLSTYCGGVDNPWDASASIDVNADCHRGYKWIFSDPTLRPVTTENPSEDFSLNTSGAQTMTLVVTDINGCTDTATNNFHVYNITAQFAISDSIICDPNTVVFTDQTTADTTVANWDWVFPDSLTATTQNPSHLFTTVLADTSRVFFTVQDANGCEDTISHRLYFYKPISTLSISPFFGHVCAGSPVQFNSTDYTAQGSNLNFAWTFGDGTTGSGQFTSHTYNGDTSYTAQVIYTEASSGCKDTNTVIIDVQNYPTAAIASNVDSLPALCSPQLINFLDNSSGTSPVAYTNWTFSNGLFSNLPNPAFTFNTGTYTVQLISSTSYNCRDTAYSTFTVIGPAGDFLMDTNHICLGDEIEFTIFDSTQVGGYSWDFGDGTSLTDVSPIAHPYLFIPPSGQTVAKLTVYGAGGACPVTVEKTVFIREVIADFLRNGDLDTTICMGDPLTITNTSLNADQFAWDFDDGTTSTTNSLTFNHLYNTADTFNISLSVYNLEFGCRDTIVKSVIVFNRPVFNAFNDTVCLGQVGQLTLDTTIAAYTYLWTPSTGLSNATIPNPTANLNETVNYSITVLDTTTDCSSSDQASVIVIQPLDDIYWDTTIVVGDSVALPISNQNGFVNFIWTPNTGLSCYDCSNPVHQGLEDITYTVVMEDILGCSKADGIFVIHIYPETFVDLPTTFTPNGDGVNDIIYLVGWGIKEVIYFQIFNRWGEMVFESFDMDHGWDGYYKGVLQNNDTYTFKAKVKTWRNEENEAAGFINLMR